MRNATVRPTNGIKRKKISLARATGRLIERTPWDGRSRTSVDFRVPVGTQAELSWAAGFFDGEGSTMSTGKGKYPRVSITQAGRVARPPEVLVRFCAAVGSLGEVVGPEVFANTAHRPRWVYKCHGADAVALVIDLLWPFLGEVKRAQAMRVFQTYLARPQPLRRPGVTRGRPLNRTCKRGHPYPDAYWTGRGRNCGICQEIARETYRAKKRNRRAARSEPEAA
jgi:hypothetical protein